MLKVLATGLIAMSLCCAGAYGYQWYQARPKVASSPTSDVSVEETKTDFISIAVFKNGKVDGYVTFRAILKLNDADKNLEASYLLADVIHRKLSVFSEILGDSFSPKNAKLLEEPLLAALSDKMGKDAIVSLEIEDIAFDKRIQ